MRYFITLCFWECMGISTVRRNSLQFYHFISPMSTKIQSWAFFFYCFWANKNVSAYFWIPGLWQRLTQEKIKTHFIESRIKYEILDNKSTINLLILTFLYLLSLIIFYWNWIRNFSWSTMWNHLNSYICQILEKFNTRWYTILSLLFNYILGKLFNEINLINGK